MISSILSRLVILVFGTLYPAYASYKAVRSKNVKEYVKWMMYWIVFALFTCAETFTDVLFSWFPFYYEVKIVLVLWLLSPATKGSSILYRKFVHPALSKREQEIDEYITKATEQGYHTVLNLGSKGVNYATTVIVQTAIKGGGGLVQQLRKSYSLSDLSESDPRLSSEAQAMIDEADDVLCDPRLVRRSTASRSYATRRSASESNSRAPLYFPEVDVDIGQAARVMAEQDFSYVKSSEDISSGYSSADNSAAKEHLLTRAGSTGTSRGRTRTPSRTGLTAVRRPQAAEDSEVTVEELRDNEPFHNCDDYPTLIPSSLSPFPYPYHLSQTEPPFLFEIVDNKIKIVRLLEIGKNTNLVNTPQIVDEIEQRVEGNIVFDDAQEKTIKQKQSQVTNFELSIPEEEEIPKNEDVLTNIIPNNNKTKESNTNNNMHLKETNINDNFNDIPMAVDESQKLIGNDVHITEAKILDASSLNTEMSGKDEIEKKRVKSNSQSNDTLISTRPPVNSEKVCEVTVTQDKIIESDLQKSEKNILDVLLLNTEMIGNDEIKEKSAISNFPSNASLNSTQLSINSCKEIMEAISNTDTSSISNVFEDSEDEAFVTPGSSPTMPKKKAAGGKYVKRQAPSPPTSSSKIENFPPNPCKKTDSDIGKESNEPNTEKTKRVSPIKATLVLKPGIVKEIGPKESSSGKPTEIFISEINKRKRRNKVKSKSLNRNKHESPITKLKQLPGMLAFWHKADKNKLQTDSDSSDGYSMRSSDYEDTNDKEDIENDKDIQVTGVLSQIYKNTAEIEAGPSEMSIVAHSSQLEDNEVLNDTNNIIEKSDALQKLIDAKIVDHPEYKFTYIPLHGNYDDAYKSTDV